MYRNYDGSINWDRMNRETNEYNSRNVDRFNESTRGNYGCYDPIKEMNNRTFKANNGQYSNYYTYR